MYGVSLDISPLGLPLAAGSANNSFWLVTLFGASQQCLPGGCGYNFVERVVFSPDGRLLAVCNGFVSVWEVATRRLVDYWQVPARDVAFSPDGAYLAVAARDGVWLKRLADGQLFHRPDPASLLVFLPDGSHLVADYAPLPNWMGNTLRLYTVPNLYPAEEGGTVYPIRGMTVSPDGQHLYTGGPNDQIDRLSLPHLQFEAVVARHWQLGAFDGDSRNLWVWAVGSAQLPALHDGQGRFVRNVPLMAPAVRMSPDGRWILTTQDVVRSADGTPILTLPPSADWSNATFSPDSDYLAVPTADPSQLALYRLSDAQRMWQVPLAYPGAKLTFSADGSRLTVYGSAPLLVLDTLTGTTVYQAPVWAHIATLSADGTLLAYADTDSSIRLVDLATGAIRWQIAYSGDIEVYQLALSPDKRFLAVAIPRRVELWDIVNGEFLVDTPWYGWLPVVQFVKNGRYLAVGSAGVDFIPVPPATGYYRSISTRGLIVSQLRVSRDESRYALQLEDGSLMVARSPILDGDADGNGCVDDADLLIVLFNYGQYRTDGDLNDDGRVDDADLLIVLFNYSAGC